MIPVFIETGNSFTKVRLDVDKVSHIKSDGKQCILVKTNRELLEVSMLLGQLEEILPSDKFVRVSNSDIINIWHVDSICGRTIYLDNGDVVRSGVTDQYRNALEGRIIIIKGTQTENFDRHGETKRNY